MSKRRSSAGISTLEAPLHVVDICHKKAPLEIVPDSEETLTVSIEHRLLDCVSIGILLVGLVSSPHGQNGSVELKPLAYQPKQSDHQKKRPHRT